MPRKRTLVPPGPSRVRRRGTPRVYGQGPAPAPDLKLFWVETEDHDEDWFVVAETPEDAARFHEEFEGYDPGDASARWVAEVPPGLEDDTGHPDHDTITACGGSFISETGQRMVSFGSTTYIEGASGLREGGVVVADPDAN